MNLALVLLSWLTLKHFIVDFPLQTQRMIDEKGHYGQLGGIVHAMLHAVGTFLVMIWVLDFTSAVVIGLLDGIIHYHVDWLKQNVTRGLTPADKDFWIWLGWDQWTHQATYIFIVGIILP